MGWVGLGWVKKNGPTCISETAANNTDTSLAANTHNPCLSSISHAPQLASRDATFAPPDTCPLPRKQPSSTSAPALPHCVFITFFSVFFIFPQLSSLRNVFYISVKQCSVNTKQSESQAPCSRSSWQLANGRVIPPTTSSLMSVTYRCNAGFRLVGASERLCLPNNTWSSPAPRCVGPSLTDVIIST